ncbi:MAG: hypothetical protein QXY79_01235, partial [Candidatus Methanomethylicia archaeon]
MIAYKFFYFLTVYIPLRIRDLFINFLAFFVRRDYVVKAWHKLFKEKSLKGILPDGNLICYPLYGLKLLPIISEIYHKKIYEVENIKAFECIYDVGAHIGLFLLKN